MGRTTIRIPDELEEKIDEARDEETKKSEWFREAAREKLQRPKKDEKLEKLEERVDRIERTPVVRWFL